jgi:hypothetical protein
MATRFWSPSRTYEFEVRIADRDLTPDLYKVSILTSVDLPYQTFVLEFFLDKNDLILEKIYGQQEIQLTAKLFGTAPNIVTDQIVFSLMYLAGDLPLTPQNTIQTDTDVNRSPIQITAVSRKAFTTMATYVNDVFENTTVDSVVSSLVSKAKGTLKQDSVGRNAEILDQVLVPPTTLYQAIKYLNRTFGVFNGWLAFWCSHDNNVYLKNLTSKMRSSYLFTIYQFASNVDNTQIIQALDDNVYYTIYDVNTKYSGNTKFAVYAPTMKHIVKPKDKLSQTIQLDLESFCETYGLISQKNKIFFDKTALSTTNRQRVYKDHTGYENNQSFINANMAEEIGDLTEIKIRLEQNLKLKNLMNVGEAITFISKIDDYQELTGAYILRATQLNFTKGKDWESSADLRLIRTNRIISKG